MLEPYLQVQMFLSIMPVRLPSELWLHIFNLAHNGIPISFMLVCQAWQDLIQSNPVCWAQISIQGERTQKYADQHQLAKALERSNPRSLNLAIHITRRQSRLPWLVDIVKLVKPHVSRVKTLRISASDHVSSGRFLEMLLQEFCRRFDDRQELRMSTLVIRTEGEAAHNLPTRDVQCTGRALELLMQHAPHLINIQLPSHEGVFPIRLPDGSLPKLADLTLTSTQSRDFRPPCAPSGLLTFISKCNGVKSLTYTSMAMDYELYPLRNTDLSLPFIQEDGYSDLVALPIQFQNLTSLVVSSPKTGIAILCAINAPNLISVVLDGRETQTYDDEWYSSSHTLNNPARALLCLSKRSPDIQRLEIIALAMGNETWRWLFHGGNFCSKTLLETSDAVAAAPPFPFLRTLVIDEEGYASRLADVTEPIDSLRKGLDDTLEEASLPSLRILYLRSILTISLNSLKRWIRARDQLISEGNRPGYFQVIRDGVSEVAYQQLCDYSTPHGPEALQNVVFELSRDRQDPRFPRYWPHPYHPQKMFRRNDVFEDDAAEWVVGRRKDNIYCSDGV